MRLPEAADELPLEAVLIEPEDIEELVVATLPQTALFSSRFRECAGRALLLPRRRPDQRTPLWQQRQKAADLLAVAAKYPTFPILLEASRECLQDVFDVPALRDVLGQLRSRAVRVVTVDTTKPSPMAQSLLFNWIAAYMYEGDAPLAERRAAALALDRDLLRDLLGAEELRELLDPGVLADVELDLQHLSDGRRARSPDELHDVLRRVGDLERAPTSSCGASRPGRRGSQELIAEKRAIEIVVAGEPRVAAADDAARYRDALGGAPCRSGCPRRSPSRCRARWRTSSAATGGPTVRSPSGRWPDRFGIAESRVLGALAALESDGRVVRGEFRPTGVRREWCDAEVLRQLRRRSLATLRREVEPVEPEALARFLPAWHGIPPERRGRGRGGGGARPAGRRAARRVDPRRRRAGVARPRLPPGAARRAVHGGRGVVGRRRCHRLGRRTRPAVLRRPAAAARAGVGGPGPPGRRRARRVAHGADRTGRELLEPAPSRRAGDRRRRAAGGAVGPRVGRRGDERLAGAAAGVHRHRSWRRSRRPRSGPRPAPPGPAQPARTTGRRRPLVPGGAVARARAPHRPRPPTPRPASSSSATAWSPARPCWPRASSAGTRRCTAC